MRLLLAASLTACATSAPTDRHHTAPQPIDRWETRAEHVFVAADDCSEGPLTVELPALDTPYARRAVLRVYSSRALPLHATLKLDGRQLYTLGWAADGAERTHANAAQSRCRVGRQELPAAPVAEVMVSKAGHKPPARSAPVKATAVAAAAPPSIRELPELPQKRPPTDLIYAFELWAGTQTPLLREVEIGTVSWSGGRKGALELELWGDDMLDLSDVVFVVKEEVLVPRLPVPEYERALEAQVIAARAHVEACREQPGTPGCGGRATIEMMAAYPPPPPRAEVRPKAPSADALWVPGSWRWNGSQYLWAEGAWRVPEPPAPVVAASTPVLIAPAPPPKVNPAPAPPAPPPAPAQEAREQVEVTPPPPPPPPPAAIQPPPPPKVEAVPPAPVAGSVWTPGYWRWDGHAQVWIAGSWQVPPSVHHRWQAPGFTVNGAGVTVQIPGGWVLIGR